MARKLDSARLAALVARPGIDTRIHLSLAVVDHVVVDPEHGVFADITFLPGEESETAIVGSAYAGASHGLHLPLQEEDVVLVAVPDGDMDAGPVIICRMWSENDKPFAEMKGAASSQGEGVNEQAQNVVLRARAGANTTIIVSEGATISLKVEGAGNINLVVDGGTVNLGKESHEALDGVVHGSGFDTFTGTTYTALGNASAKVFARK